MLAELGAKEVVAFLTGMVRFHSLQSMYEETPALEVYRVLFCDDAPFYMAPRPEAMPHRAPWLLRICAKIALPILSHMEAWCVLRDGEVDDARFIHDRLDRVRGAIFAQGNRTAVRMKTELLLIKVDVAKSVRGPKWRRLVIGIEDFGIKLACRMDTADSKRASAWFARL